MRHNLDVKPVPENVIYINELDFILPDVYENCDTLKRARSGVTVSDGGVLPDDNVRIYLPLDINADSIMYQLGQFYSVFGEPTEDNESMFSNGVRKIINQLEVYDQFWYACEINDAVQGKTEESCHSKRGLILAKKIVSMLKENEGIAESFPYAEIEELEQEYRL